MIIKIVVAMEYLAKNSKSGRYLYRRRVPGDLIKLIGKREFSFSLRTTDQRLALERYERAHREVESKIEAARAIDPADADHRATLQALRKHDLVAPTQKSLAPVTFDTEPQTFIRFTDAALRASDHEFDRIVEAKFYGVQEPPLRLSKAVTAYLGEHRDGDNERDLRKHTKLVVDLIREVAKDSDPLVEAINIEVAYAFRDTLRANGIRAKAESAPPV